MTESAIQNPTSSIHWPSVWQLVFSLLSTLSLWGLALVLGLMSLSSLIGAPASTGTGGVLPLLLTAAGMTFGGLLLLPSAGYALLRIMGRPSSFSLKLRRPGWLILAIPPLVGLGFLVTQNENVALFLLPPLHGVVIGLSVLWIVTFSLRGLSVGSPQRGWGIFGTGLIMAPFFSLVFELILILGVGYLAIGYLVQDPVLESELARIIQQFSQNPEMAPNDLLKNLEPFLTRPTTIYFGLIIGAVLVPLVEELFKPVGVWLLAGRNPTPAQGFAAGVLSGAGFALFESYTLSASSGEEWALVVMARIGTTMIHVLTAGLTGWALALAWREKRYLRLGLTFFPSVLIHGLWNGLVILSIAPEILPSDANYPQALINIGTAAPFGFGVLLVGGFVLLLGCNLSLRRATSCPDRV